uniref:Peptidase C1A papain C-terminal domain-containing protein n=1 Tax=Panagrolaimus davidi TaxID=227884 RepID=A0A914P3N6_9BILA
MNYTSQHGIPLESCYPYTAKNGTCKNICPSPRYKIAGVNRLSDKNESTYAEALFLGGPIPFWLNIPRPVLNYKSGILDFPEKECAEQSKGSHFMVLVGYTPTYWIAKNCWGRDWGEDGYMRFKRGQNFCNMTRSVFQPYL